jgi:hypothetical protein
VSMVLRFSYTVEIMSISSPSQVVGSWFRVLLGAWMSVCVYSLFMCFCLWKVALWSAGPLSGESGWNVSKIKIYISETNFHTHIWCMSLERKTLKVCFMPALHALARPFGELSSSVGTTGIGSVLVVAS